MRAGLGERLFHPAAAGCALAWHPVLAHEVVCDDVLVLIPLLCVLAAESFPGHTSAGRFRISLENAIHFRVYCLIDALTSFVGRKPCQRPADAIPERYDSLKTRQHWAKSAPFGGM